MKKIVFIVVAASFAFSVTACSKEKSKAPDVRQLDTEALKTAVMGEAKDNATAALKAESGDNASQQITDKPGSDPPAEGKPEEKDNATAPAKDNATAQDKK
jgi:hypothetical protein